MQLEPKQFASAMAQICEEKGISHEKAMEIVEAALVAAYRKDYGRRGQNLKVKFNEVSGDMEVTLLKEIVETVEEDGILYLMENEDEEAIEVGETKKTKETEKQEIISENDYPKDSDEGFVPLSQLAEKPKKKFNPESHLTLEEARKINSDAKVGDILTFPMSKPEGFGRIAAQTAKQVIIQRIREAEREAIFKEYHAREGEIVNGTVQRVERKTVFVDLGRSVGVILPQEQISGENYRIGGRIKAYILKVEAEAKESAVILSRAHENFVKKLFEMEVPEIFSGAVEIKSVAREAGSRTKIAVVSKESGIDPIGSCVGQKGTRVQTVINELSGEKIDIIEWSENSIRFIINALSPAKVDSVEITDKEQKQARVKVPADQLSLAIGKQGQNVRLAAKLTGWKLDVYGEERQEEKEAEQTKEVK